MRISRSIALTALFTTCVVAQTPAVGPDTFTHRSTVELGGAGPFHQIALPIVVYQGMQQSNFGDLRVFNAQGEVVPHALIRKLSKSVTTNEELSVPLFPIVSPASKASEATDLTIEVRKNADDTLVAVRRSPTAVSSAKPSVIRGVVVDISRIKHGVRALRLSVGPTTVPFHAYSIETSDDLQQWRVLKQNAQLVQMEHGGQRIERNIAEWSNDAGKYLRLMWLDPQQAPAISAVSVNTVETSFDPAPRIWSAPMAATKTQENTYRYTLPGRLPLEWVRINLPQLNTLTQLQLQRFVTDQRRNRKDDYWATIAQAVVYRLQSPQGEVISPDIDLHAAPEGTLQVVVDARSGGVGATAPTLQVGFIPHSLIFLARGAAPFTLAWGASPVANTALDIATLVPGFGAGGSLPASIATLKLAALGAKPDAAGGAPQEAQSSAPIPASKSLLWTVLIVGVLVLGGMAAMLIKQMKQPAPPKQD